MRQLVTTILLIVILVTLFFVVPPFSSRIGHGDFRAYWSASYLLAHHENMYDGELMLRTQRAYTGALDEFPLITLSPPWSVLMFLPLTLLPFERAAWIWLLINTLLLGTSAMVLWQNVRGEGRWRHWIWIPLLAAYAFSINLTAILDGQTTVFTLAMVAAFLAFERSRRDLLAGIALAATLVKPQTVFVTLLVVALYVIQTRRWRMAWGFGGMLAATALVLWTWRASWLPEYLANVAGMNALGWESSNLGGILLVLTGWTGAKFVGLALVPLLVPVWMRVGTVNFRVIVDVSLLLSLITAPYGFSYDQTLLLAPLLTLLALIASGVFHPVEGGMIVGSLVVADAISYYERVQTPSEVYFFWVPLVVAAAYLYCLWRATRAGAIPAAGLTIPVVWKRSLQGPA